MSDLVGNPEDWFSRVEAHFLREFFAGLVCQDDGKQFNISRNMKQVKKQMSLCMRKPTIWVSDQVQHKPACTVTEETQNLENLGTSRGGNALSM